MNRNITQEKQMTKQEALKISKPILFNTEMTKAIQNGTKTTTRRIVKCRHNNTELEMFTNKYGTRLIEIQKQEEGVTHGVNEDGSQWQKLRPYIEPKSPYKVGDILYVRETWFYECHMEDMTAGEPDLPSGCYSHRYVYKASSPDYPVDVGVGANGWRPSIHMPKEAARIFLRVTGVRVERLQDIDENGIRNEGLSSMAVHVGDMEIAQAEFAHLWNTTVKKSDLDRYGWDANPWVWVIEFEMIEVTE